MRSNSRNRRSDPGHSSPPPAQPLGRGARAGEDRLHGFRPATLLAESGARKLAAHGTLYKALGRSESFGLLHSSWEDPDRAAVEQRPRRRLYEVTGRPKPRSRRGAPDSAPRRARRAAWGQS